jgi:four helix bundle protein
MSKYQQLKDIEVYMLARRLAERVWNEVADWDHFTRRTVGQQLVRAVDSISANIAESYGRHHVRDVVMFLYYARGSLYETQDWLSKAVQRKLFPDEMGRELLDTIQLIAPKLNAYISAKTRRNPPNNQTT